MPIRIILADDHRILREGLKGVLSTDADIEVIGEADNGRDTVKLTRQMAPNVVVMDVAMPDLNGVDATRQIIDNDPHCRVLALSMHSDSRFVKGMLRAGASGYMLKDCAADELNLAIHAVVSNRTYVSPGIAGIIVNELKQGSDTALERTPQLSAREQEVLQLIAKGHSTAESAALMKVSVKTVETHRKRMMDKLDIRSVAELTKYAIREGIISLDD